MAEELRYFVRTAIWIAAALVVYWIVSQEPAGTALLAFLLVAPLAFAIATALLVPSSLAELRGGGPLALVNRLVGFHERTEHPPPLQAGSELIPLGSAWPIVTAAAFVVIGLGLIFGPWLLLPGVAVLVLGGVGWLTQLDR